MLKIPLLHEQVDDAFITGVLRDGYNKIKNELRDRGPPLEIASVSKDYMFYPTREKYMTWCANETSVPLNETYIFLKRNDILADMMCLWNKTMNIHLKTFKV